MRSYDKLDATALIKFKTCTQDNSLALLAIRNMEQKVERSDDPICRPVQLWSQLLTLTGAKTTPRCITKVHIWYIKISPLPIFPPTLNTADHEHPKAEPNYKTKVPSLQRHTARRKWLQGEERKYLTSPLSF